MGRTGTPRDSIFCSYDPRPGWDKDRFRKLVFARNKRYKLYEDGRLFDISNDQLEHSPVLKFQDTYAQRKVREKLSLVLKENNVNP